ncbi:N-acetylmuramic acid 6-phosphate etherase [Lactobacillus kullabergensis]|uniref:N-acetylmuramic acid 6-phosphate etherase n=1 Tax=Lactobacillus kullabergensis TaxID=1218493 RepID=A0ABN5LI47_9LACO|nr:N-acetylmuramic acid 6-phosphate etherase [Lactobacillus kullabergensis]AWM75860.1 N-acetylmuramic acid 6-phosphate etherase [Lactobacillus kullabergensis]
MEIKNLETEARNPATTHIDTMSTSDMVKTINAEDQKVALAVAGESDQIAKAIDQASTRYSAGGRLIYIGAGTSGRLGVLDAAELVPTYGIKPERAIGLIAGGKKAMFAAVEGAEDSITMGETDLKNLKLTANDIVIGLAASGRTPYVIGGLKYAAKVQALTIAVACVPNSVIGQIAEIAINAVVGPEVITGSTRMKAGTAQKMILNMISTGVMIRQGKVYQNVMVDVQPTNDKLVDRACRIISETAEIPTAKALSFLKKADNDVALAIVMAKTGKSKIVAKQLLAKYHGIVSDVLNSLN